MSPFLFWMVGPIPLRIDPTKNPVKHLTHALSFRSGHSLLLPYLSVCKTAID